MNQKVQKLSIDQVKLIITKWSIINQFCQPIFLYLKTATNQVSKTLSIDSERSADSTTTKTTEALDDVDEESDSDDEESMSKEEALSHQQKKKEEVSH